MKIPLRVFIFGLPLFPFIILLAHFSTHVSDFSRLDLTEASWALYNTVLQASFSAVLSLVLGWWMAQGLLAVTPKFGLRKILEAILIIPNLLPALFVILSVLQVVDPFPIGIIGISFVHMLLNAGFVAVLIAQLLQNKLGSLAEMAFLDGASPGLFFRRVAWPILRGDLFKIFSFVFIICFTSFSVPLILGGGRGTTLEVLIYEKIHISNEWVQAVHLSILQSLILAGFGLFHFEGFGKARTQALRLDLVQNRFGWVVMAALFWPTFAGYITGFVTSVNALLQLPQLDFLFPALVNTWGIGMGVGLLVFFILGLILYLCPDVSLQRYLLLAVSPSQVLVALSLLLVGPNEGMWSFAKVIAALVILQIVPLFRSGLASPLQQLEGQMQMAHALGASRYKTFREITFPQLSDGIGLLAGIGAVWAFGDFGVGKIIFSKEMTLGMNIESLLSSYRIDAALGLGLILVAAGALQFLFFWRLGNVFSRKP